MALNAGTAGINIVLYHDAPIKYTGGGFHSQVCFHDFAASAPGRFPLEADFGVLWQPEKPLMFPFAEQRCFINACLGSDIAPDGPIFRRIHCWFLVFIVSQHFFSISHQRVPIQPGGDQRTIIAGSIAAEYPIVKYPQTGRRHKGFGLQRFGSRY